MTDLFISDLHLDADRPGITRLFLEFLAGQARAAKRLFILGDLFESWVGDDNIDPLSESVAGGLCQLAKSGTEVGFIHGNRDFLLGGAYLQRCQMALLPDPSVIQLAGQNAVICHGDTLCTDDSEYQRFRQSVRNPLWQKAFLAKPLADRLAFAQQARLGSASYTAQASQEIMDVNAGAVESLLRSSNAKLLIHGHTHRPAIHDLSVAERPARRIVLGDWYEQGSVLLVDERGQELVSIG